jgi:hypothetical protein
MAKWIERTDLEESLRGMRYFENAKLTKREDAFAFTYMMLFALAHDVQEAEFLRFPTFHLVGILPGKEIISGLDNPLDFVDYTFNYISCSGLSITSLSHGDIHFHVGVCTPVNKTPYVMIITEDDNYDEILRFIDKAVIDYDAEKNKLTGKSLQKEIKKVIKRKLDN